MDPPQHQHLSSQAATPLLTIFDSFVRPFVRESQLRTPTDQVRNERCSENILARSGLANVLHSKAKTSRLFFSFALNRKKENEIRCNVRRHINIVSFSKHREKNERNSFCSYKSIDDQRVVEIFTDRSIACSMTMNEEKSRKPVKSNSPEEIINDSINELSNDPNKKRRTDLPMKFERLLPSLSRVTDDDLDDQVRKSKR